MSNYKSVLKYMLTFGAGYWFGDRQRKKFYQRKISEMAGGSSNEMRELLVDGLLDAYGTTASAEESAFSNVTSGFFVLGFPGPDHHGPDSLPLPIFP